MTMPKQDTELEEILENLWEYGFNSNGDFPTEHRSKYQRTEEAKQKLLAWRDKSVNEAKKSENQMYLDRINNFKPKPGQLTAANFGAAGAGMVESGFKKAFESRIEELNHLNKKGEE